MTSHATLNGTITNTMGENCDERGFDWGYESGVYDYEWSEEDNFGIGSFSHQITGLDLNKTVYFRAKAHNSGGWGYGSEKSFQTPSPVTIKFLTNIVRIVARPINRAKITREDIVVHLRKQYRKFEKQPQLKSSDTL